MKKIISVYFSGTGFSIKKEIFLAHSFYERTKISNSEIKIGFNGCGLDFGLKGLLFGNGLDKQCDEVISRVTQELNQGHQVVLNVYGHSRGGIAGLLLAKQLSHMDEKKLCINLALLDPVPGNFITSAIVDSHEMTLAKKTMDLSDCKPLKNVLAIYPHIPLPSVAAHAPLLASYPSHAAVDEEVIDGCHAEAERVETFCSKLVRLRVEEFLLKHGTQLKLREKALDNQDDLKNLYLYYYQNQLASIKSNSTREAHSNRGVVITAQLNASYLNSRHKTLAGDTTSAPVALSIETEQGVGAKIKRFFIKHPAVGQAIILTLIALQLMWSIYFTFGLAAIPFLVPVVAKLGVLSIVALTPVVTVMLAALWYGAIRPIASWCVEKWAYPFYAMRKLDLVETGDSESSSKALSAMGKNNSPNTAPTPAPYQGKSPLRSSNVIANKPVAVPLHSATQSFC